MYILDFFIFGKLTELHCFVTYLSNDPRNWNYFRHKAKRATYRRRWIHDLEDSTGLEINIAAERTKSTVGRVGRKIA